MKDTQLEVMAALKAPFPDKVVESRTGPAKKNSKTGKYEKTTFSYVPVNYVIERLDEVLGLHWSWQCLDTKIYQNTKTYKDYETGTTSEKQSQHVAVLGRLCILPGACPELQAPIFRDAWGGCELEKGSQSGDPFKIADSNAFKKAAYKFGVCAYLGLEGLENSDLREDTPSSNYPTAKRGKKTKEGTTTTSNPFLT